MPNRNCYTPELVPFEEARARLLNRVTALQQVETVSLAIALGRVVAENIMSPINVPGFDNSAMDGFALKAVDLNHQSSLRMVGKAYAGAPYQGSVKSGECVRIMTGAKIPAGTDAVVMQEQAIYPDDLSIGDVVEIRITPKPGSNIRKAGEDIQKQQLVLDKGHRLSPPDIGLLASLGIAEVLVYRKLRVAFFSTGDELTAPGQPLTEGAIYDSNRCAGIALLQKLPCEVKDFGLLPDQPDVIEKTLLQADSWADVVISSGGVSVGEADHIKPLIGKLGQLELWKIAIKPGKPFAYGKLPNSHFIGLPGNPVSALVTLYQLAVPMLKKMQGTPHQPPLQFNAICESAIRKRPGRKDFQRGLAWADQLGRWRVKTTGAQGSGILSSMSNANCFIVLEAEQSDVKQGSEVTIELFSDLLN